MDQTRTDRFKTAILLLAVIGLITGLAFFFAGIGDIANIVWFAVVVPALAALVVDFRCSIGRGEVGLVFGETLAAAVVAVIYSGGTFLESSAEGRARRETHNSCPGFRRRRHCIAMAASKTGRFRTSLQATGC